MEKNDAPKDMVSFEEARNIVLKSVSVLPSEYMQLSRAAGRVLAENIKSRVDVPLDDISLRDGYALRARDTAEASSDNNVMLKVVGESLAGAPTDAEIKEGQAVAVNTGGVIPAGADAVVPREEVHDKGQDIVISEAVEKGAFIVKKGEEFKERELICESGTVLDVGSIASMIAGGQVEVHVFGRPRVHVIAAGDEFRSPGRGLLPGQGYPGMAYGITAEIESIGVEGIRIELVPDEKKAILEALPEPGAVDMVVTIGGTGQSSRDMVVTDLEGAGVIFMFHGVRMRPCHSMAFGLMDNKIPVLCLPGGISAAELGYYQFVLPVIMKLMGQREFGLPEVRARMERDVTSPPGQRHFIRCMLERDKSGKDVIARPLRRKKIYQEMIQSHGYIVIAEDKEGLDSGDEVMVQITRKGWLETAF